MRCRCCDCRRCTGILELLRLDRSEVAEGDADFHAELADVADGVEHLLKFRVAVAHAFPCGTHAEAGGAVFAGALCGGHDVLFHQEPSCVHARGIAGALGAIAAILAATAGLDAEQRAELDLAAFPVLEIRIPALLDEFEERLVVDVLEFGELHGVISD